MYRNWSSIGWDCQRYRHRGRIKFLGVMEAENIKAKDVYSVYDGMYSL